MTDPIDQIIAGMEPTHRCAICGAFWQQWPDTTWSLCSEGCGTCCDNAPMGGHIKLLGCGVGERGFPMPDMDGFQRRIRDSRKARRMSLDDVAAAAGFTKSHVWELERGSSKNPTVRAVWGLAKALGVTPAWLLGLDTNASPIDPLALEISLLIERRLAVRDALPERGK